MKEGRVPTLVPGHRVAVPAVEHAAMKEGRVPTLVSMHTGVKGAYNVPQ